MSNNVLGPGQGSGSQAPDSLGQEEGQGAPAPAGACTWAPALGDFSGVGQLGVSECVLCSKLTNSENPEMTSRSANERETSDPGAT